MKNIFLLSFLIFSVQLMAQDLELKWSKTEEFSSKSPEPVTVGIDEEYILLLKGKNYDAIEDFWIDIYDRKDFSFKRKIDFKNAQFKPLFENSIEKIYYKDKKITIITNRVEDEKVFLIGTIINVDGTVVTLSKILDQIDNEGKRNSGSISIMANDEHDRFLIHTNLPTEKKENEQIRYKIIDNDFKVYTDKMITLPYRDDLFVTENTLIDSKGNVYLLGTKYETKADKRNSNGTSVFFIFSIESGEFNEIKFPIVHNLMWGYAITFNDKDNLVIEGRYLDRKPKDVTEEGIFSLEMEGISGKILQNNAWEITEALLPKGLEDYSFNDPDGNRYTLRNLFDISEDKKMAIMEFNSAFTYCSNNNCVQTINMENMLVMILNMNGKIESINVVPKNQQLKINVSQGLFYNAEKRNAKFRALTSYATLYKDKTLYLLYNDHSKNITKNFPESFKKTRFQSETACFLAKVTVDGKISRDILLKKKDEDGFLITPKNSIQISESEILIFATQRDEMIFKFGIINIK